MNLRRTSFLGGRLPAAFAALVLSLSLAGTPSNVAAETILSPVEPATLNLKAGGFRFDRTSGDYVQAVTVTNTGESTARGRLFVEVRGLAEGRFRGVPRSRHL